MEQSKILCAHAHTGGIIGLDLGSTRSAAAITVPSLDADQKPVLECVDKFPTILSLIKNSTKPVIRFIPPGMAGSVAGLKLRCCKILLMEPTSKNMANCEVLKHLDEEINNLDVNLPENSVVVAKFLEGLWAEALKKLRQLYSDQAANSPHVVITYPSTWNPAEISQLAVAVRLARIEQESCRACEYGVTYCTEKEAAVHAALFDHTDKLREIYRNGDSIIVADCGGMTTDSAVYTFYPPETRENFPSPGIVGYGKSSFVGGLSVDHAFIKEISGRVASGLSESDISRACSSWARYGRPFTGLAPLREFFNFTSGSKCDIVLNRTSMLQIFDPTTEIIAKDVCDLYTKTKSLEVIASQETP